MQRVIEQVAGILHRNGDAVRDPGGRQRLPDHARFERHLHLVAQYGETVMVSVHSPVLQEIEQGNQLLDILTAVNDLNAGTRFARFVYYPEERVIAVEYDGRG